MASADAGARPLLGSVTREAVLTVVAEVDRIGRDQFLKKHGFERARTYELVVGDQRYDSKAVVGVAYGIANPLIGPLRPRDFSGGEATVVVALRTLGFHVASSGGNRTGWAEEERILALELYLRRGMVDDNDPEVIALSEELGRRRFHPDAGSRENFRNANGVAMKLGNFAALDPSTSALGLPRFAAGDLATWNEYAGDTDRLRAAVAVIRDGHEAPALAELDQFQLEEFELERVHTETYDFVVPNDGMVVTVDRAEGSLVHRFARWLDSNGHHVGARRFPVERSMLRTDLVDFTDRRLWEAKSDVSRSNVRMAIGQLADYRRLERGFGGDNLATGVLLPREPSRDLLGLIHSVDASGAWAVDLHRFHIEPAA